jgi:hypothetical protein
METKELTEEMTLSEEDLIYIIDTLELVKNRIECHFSDYVCTALNVITCPHVDFDSFIRNLETTDPWFYSFIMETGEKCWAGESHEYRWGDDWGVLRPTRIRILDNEIKTLRAIKDEVYP